MLSRARRQAALTPVSLAVAAARPAAGPALSFLELLAGAADAPLPGLLPLCVLHPADELVARQGRDVHPCLERRAVRDELGDEVRGHLVHDAAGELLDAHLPEAIGAPCGARDTRRTRGAIVARVSVKPTLVEFPADDPQRARSFWAQLLGVELEARGEHEGQGWQTRGDGTAVGVHERGRGPGDSFSLPYFRVEDLAATLERVGTLGGSVIHPGSQWAICRDSEGSPFGLEQAPRT